MFLPGPLYLSLRLVTDSSQPPAQPARGPPVPLLPEHNLREGESLRCLLFGVQVRDTPLPWLLKGQLQKQHLSMSFAWRCVYCDSPGQMPWNSHPRTIPGSLPELRGCRYISGAGSLHPGQVVRSGGAGQRRGCFPPQPCPCQFSYLSPG